MRPGRGPITLAGGLLLMLLLLSACTPIAAEDEPAICTVDGEATAQAGTLADRLGQPAPDFELIDQHGVPFRLSEQRGNVVFLFFGYTMCPDVCPTTLLEYRRAHTALGVAADQVRFVYITVDPERDTPEHLQKYLPGVGHESFLGLSGERAVLEAVWHDYNVYVERAEMPESAVGYWVNHSALTYMIDPDGNLARLYPFGTHYEQMLEDIFQVTGQRPPTGSS